jgi:Family of unknown function (DUF5522)
MRENRTMDEEQPTTPNRVPPLESEDYYMEGPNLVFTAAYHLKRGYCCGSGCRHCPYTDPKIDESNPAESV